jgi:hypothetical protein
MAARKPIVQAAGSLQQLQSGDTLDATIQGTRIYAKSATDPSSPTPADGDLYYNTAINEWMEYDGSRSKWLSIATYTFLAGRSGNTAAGSFYRGQDGLTFATNVGYEVPKGTIVGLSWARTDADAATLEVLVGGSVISTLASAAAGGTASWTKNDDFSAGLMQFRNQAGGNVTTDVQAVCVMRRRV